MEIKTLYEVVFPYRKYNDDLYACYALKKEVKNLVSSPTMKIPLIMLGRLTGMELTPTTPPEKIGEHILNFIINSCLSMDPHISAPLTVAWGLNIVPPVSYELTCNTFDKLYEISNREFFRILYEQIDGLLPILWEYIINRFTDEDFYRFEESIDIFFSEPSVEVEEEEMYEELMKVAKNNIHTFIDFEIKPEDLKKRITLDHKGKELLKIPYAMEFIVAIHDSFRNNETRFDSLDICKDTSIEKRFLQLIK